jgi:tetratricopeptide (TPR) repeat protein
MVPTRQSHISAWQPVGVLLCLLSLVPLVGHAQAPQPAAGRSCEAAVARLISFQGVITTRRVGGPQLQPVSLNDRFCVGDVLEVGAFSRAALQLPDQTVVRLDQGTVVTFAAPQDDKRTWLDILKGALHVISRDPRALRVVTPFANAGIEGTEFLVQVAADSATVLVFEGRVKVQNASGAATAASGESVLAKAGSAPVLQQVVRPRDQVVWTLYYLPTGSGPLPGADAPATGTPGADFYVGRAEQRLALGRVTEGEADLTEALKLAPGSSEVLARQSVIALTRNDAATATALADQAVAASPGSISARLAQSYARQSAADLPGAIRTLEAAAADHPDDALVRARLAELYLASGDVDRSEASARAAVAADPQLGLARTILGFAKLTRVQLPEARAAFDEAIRLDPGAPLPRLGLGLARIRDGDLAAGREEIETAVILDPNNSLVRSYMGKAYYEEKRDKLAASQFGIAKELDPNDPTPWFYDAIRKQTVNDPVGALGDLRKSAELNDRRAVYRSGLLLDDDSAARNASVSAIYDELGFEALAVLEGTKALTDSFGNSSAHRLLSNAYARLPRYDISRVSEAFQAQIRQPLSVPPVNLLESAADLTVLRDAGPSRVGVNEYNSLFSRDQSRVQADLVVGSRGTLGDQFVVSGLDGPVGFAFSQLHYETDGFTENNAAEKDIYGGLVQWQVSPATSLQVDGRHSEYSLGYTFYPFDPDNFFPVVVAEDSDLVRLNGRHAVDPGSDWIWTVGYEDRTRDAIYEPESILVTTTDANTYTAEVQRLGRIGAVQVVAGAGYIDKNEDFPIETQSVDTDDANAYLYGQWRSADGRLTLIGGAALDLFEQDYTAFDESIKRTQLSPKIGVVWTPLDGTTLRAAAFTAVRRPFIASQTLEPTQVASFNQFFTGLEQFYGDQEGTVSRRVGAAIDQSLSETVFAGIEGAVRHLEVPLVYRDSDQSWREKSARTYLYKSFAGPDAAGPASGWNATFSISGEYENLSRAQYYTGPEGILDLDTYRVPVGLFLFAPRGLALRLVTSYVRQDGERSIDIGLPVVSIDEDAWLTDIFLEYRLPKRFGVISVGARNIFDNELSLVDTNPLSPRDAQRRLVSGRVSVTF